MWSPYQLRRLFLNFAVAALCVVSCQLEAQSVGQKPPEFWQPVTSSSNTGSSSVPVDQPVLSTEPPGAIYKEAMRPLAVVRQSIENWSDSELAALSIGIHMAHESCEKMNPDDYGGDDLYDLAHLCAFGQDWNPANTAAQHYIRDRAARYRAQSYAISIGAYVHINAPDLALATTRAMLRTEPYDAEAAHGALSEGLSRDDGQP